MFWGVQKPKNLQENHSYTEFDHLYRLQTKFRITAHKEWVFTAELHWQTSKMPYC